MLQTNLESGGWSVRLHMGQAIPPALQLSLICLACCSFGHETFAVPQMHKDYQSSSGGIARNGGDGEFYQEFLWSL